VRFLRTIAVSAALCPGLGMEAAAQDAASGLHFETADRELIERLARENAVETTVPRRGVLAYLEYLRRRLGLWLMDLLEPFGQYANELGGAIAKAAFAAAGLTALLLVFLGVRHAVRRRSRLAPDPSRSAIPGPETHAPSWDGARWRQELERRIADADVAGSLEAVWWWLARSLLGSRVQESWTSGDLLSRARGAGLREPLRRLERMMYGTRKPSLEEVHELVRSLERQLA
jgi:hypothetical protein